MNRRSFLENALRLVPAAVSPRAFAGDSVANHAIEVRLDLTRTIATIPADFTGLGYEISSVARPGLLSAENEVYVQLVRTLGACGAIRVGGNTADYASYSANGSPLSSPEDKAGSIVNDAVLRDLGRFLTATGWQLIWALNLGSRDQVNAIDEAKAVSAAVGDHLLAFEIGNEPDLFARRHRPADYSYAQYLAEFRRFRDVLRKAIPIIPLAAPDAAREIDWVTKIAADEGKQLKLLTAHYYRGGAKNPASTIDELLHDDPNLEPMLQQLKAASESSGVPYRICETNSFFGGGKPGVSDTFASALWVLDFMFTLACAGCAGVNMETGVNQLGFISSYSPVADDERGHYCAAPEYYGMLAFKASAGGRIVGCTIDARGKNIKAYAVQAEGRLILTLINKEPAYDADVLLMLDSSMQYASMSRLIAPTLESRSSVTLGGTTVSGDGSWKPTQVEKLSPGAGQLHVRAPSTSATLLELTRTQV
jgi:hypothetical protein